MEQMQLFHMQQLHRCYSPWGPGLTQPSVNLPFLKIACEITKKNMDMTIVTLPLRFYTFKRFCDRLPGLEDPLVGGASTRSPHYASSAWIQTRSGLGCPDSGVTEGSHSCEAIPTQAFQGWVVTTILEGNSTVWS